MAIWHHAPQTLLTVLLDSTDKRFYFTELCVETGLDRKTVSGILVALTAAGLLKRQPESQGENGAPRVYYSLTANGVVAFRLSV